MRRIRWRTVLAAVVCLAAGTAGALSAPPHQAEAAATYYGVFTFDKNPNNPSNSRLHWDVFRNDLDAPRRVLSKSWRAGSGVIADSCASRRGWLPNGTYSVTFYPNWGNSESKIHGRAFKLGSHRCANGTNRTELFIHTETGDKNRRCDDTPGDQSCRWEYPRYNDYRSEGCIKLSPTDLKAASDAFTAISYKPGRTYSARLIVTS